VSRRTGSGWTLPHNEAVPNFQNKSVGAGGHITPDKTVFVFSSDTSTSHLNEDIYVSFKVGTRWTEPKNLGPDINTKNPDITPWLSADTKTLFFASNNQPSFGSFDIFSSERLDSTWVKWSPPKNLGPETNSVGRELFYSTVDGKIFYTSTLNSEGQGDIKERRTPDVAKVLAPVLKEKNDSIPKIHIAQKIVPVDIPDNGLTNIFGRVTDSGTGKPVQANIVFYGPSMVFVSSSEEGSYKAGLLPKSLYSVRVESHGYFGYFAKINLIKQQERQLEINFTLRPVSVGTSVNLQSVLFKQSTPDMLPESYDELDMVVDFLKINPTVEIELEGHTDNAGDAEANLKLSHERVAVVKNYITQKGIAPRRIQGIGYGGANPIASNRTEEGRRLNRRVEFKILKE
jgi:OmpA-OmpF porin, OOP family